MHIFFSTFARRDEFGIFLRTLQMEMEFLFRNAELLQKADALTATAEAICLGILFYLFETRATVYSDRLQLIRANCLRCDVDDGFVLLLSLIP